MNNRAGISFKPVHYFVYFVFKYIALDWYHYFKFGAKIQSHHANGPTDTTVCLDNDIPFTLEWNLYEMPLYMGQIEACAWLLIAIYFDIRRMHYFRITEWLNGWSYWSSTTT